ncbi:MAG: Hpt domain-containing protein [Gammaproteobacteria bacterium]|nr:Hpt domain-containing protein [Gammaproteobacteria bacterium]
MQLGNTVQFNSLKWVKEELQQIIVEIQRMLEAFIEAPDDRGRLDEIINLLRQVRGTLSLVEIYGASLLCEEMEEVVRGLRDDTVPNRENAEEVLLAAVFKLPSYLDSLAAGNKDVPMVLLPLLNDLRACRNAALLSENVLFFPDTSVATGTYDGAASAAQKSSGEDIQALAKQLRHHYQLGLLGWFKGQDSEAGLKRMRQVISRLRRAANDDASRRLWWVSLAITEALAKKGVDASVALKSLMGKVDRQIKNLSEQPEKTFVKTLPEQLTKNILYYVARAKPVSDTIVQVQKDFNLDRYLASDEDRARAEQQMTGPTQELLEKVAEAVHEDVNQAKDLLEIFAETANKDINRIREVLPLYTKIADTLGMLGMGGARESVLDGRNKLDAAIKLDTAPSENALMQAAGVLLIVENELEAYVHHRQPEPANVNARVSEADNKTTSDNQRVIGAVVNEAYKNISRLKDAFLRYVQDNEVEHLKEIPPALKELAGAMFVSPLDAVVGVIAGMHDYFVQTLIAKPRPLSEREQDRLADVVTNIECFLEAAAENRMEMDLYVAAAEDALSRLRSGNVQGDVSEYENDDNIFEDDGISLDDLTSEFEAVDGEGNGPTLEDITGELSALAADLSSDIHSLDIDAAVVDDEMNFSSRVIASAPAATVPVSKKRLLSHAELTEKYAHLQIIGQDADEEILEIFIEEALEELNRLNEYFPLWQQDHGSGEAVTTIRRSFHTLKGSGRLMGATLIGEFAWAMETMLNRFIEGTINTSPALFAVIEEAITVLPQLIAQLRGDEQPADNVFELMQQAEQVSLGALRRMDESTLAEEPAESEQILLEVADGDVSNDIGDDDNFGGEEMAREEIMLETTSVPMAARRSTDSIELDNFADIDELDQFANIETPSASDSLIAELDGINLEEPSLDEFGHEDFFAEADNDSSDNDEIELLSLEEEIDTAKKLPTNVGPAVQIDSVLLEIFTDEVRHLNKVITGFTQTARHTNVTAKDKEVLIRALHTMHGSAKTAKCKGMAEMAKAMELHSNNLIELGEQWAALELSLLDELVRYVDASLEYLHEHTAELIDEQNLTIRLQECLAQSQPRVESFRETQQQKTGSMITEEIDSELLDIFMEEAPDMVESTDHALQTWLESGYSTESFSEILRQLHTLKGSAHMASLSGIGDLAHAMESLFIPIGNKKLKMTPALQRVLQEAVDRLSSMLEQVRQGQMPYLTPEYAALLEAARHGNLPETTAVHQAVQVPEEPEKTGSNVIFAADVSSAEAQMLAVRREMDAKQAIGFDMPDVTDVGDKDLPSAATQIQQDLIRVRADRLDAMVNFAGEVNIYQSRLGKQFTDITFNLGELEQTVRRLRLQLRDMDMQTEAQIASRVEREMDNPNEDFDPLEMDRYSNMQQLSRSLAESANDIENIRDALGDLVRDSEVMVLQQSRVSTELQEELLQTRMVRFEGLTNRLRRLVRQTAQQLKKKVELRVLGAEQEIDRSVQDRMLAPLEHMLRNAVFHGIETPEERRAADKNETGIIQVSIERDGSYIVMNVADDGRGIDPAIIRRKAIEKGLMAANDPRSDQEVMQFILHEGFSTADSVSQLAGRGVGMDVVDTEIKELGGSLIINSKKGKGTVFSIRLPLTLAINQALLIQVGEDVYAISLAVIEGVARISNQDVEKNLSGEVTEYQYAGDAYHMFYLGSVLAVPKPANLNTETQFSLLLIRAGERRLAAYVDNMLGRREIVVKPVGSQISSLPGISGATILADGRVALILEPGALMRSERDTALTQFEAEAEEQQVEQTITHATRSKHVVMIVDDSITIRKVTARILARHNLEILTAKDGLDAIEQLRDHIPDLFLMDIEMPRMDGFELASHVRGDPRLQHIPIIMITSRTGEKHRERARKIGVERYLGKPFQEVELMQEIDALLGRESV